MKLQICYYGNPILRKKCEPVQEINNEIRQLAQDMVETMDAYNGIGLAAPQIGRSIRMFVLRRYIHETDEKWTVSDPVIYINPQILAHTQETWITEEGCLSIPKLSLPVERPIKIKVESTRLDGTQEVEELEGINARVVLHENDHINGVLYIDRVKKEYLREVEDRLRAIKKEYK